MKYLAFLYLCFAFAAVANAATIYVRKDGNDSNNGLADTSGGAKLTLQAGLNLATSAGDIVRVGVGAYLERGTIAGSGSAGNLITITTNGTGTVVVRGFVGDNRDYIRIRGFEITHTSNALNYHGIHGQNGSDHWEVLDNYIHHIDGYNIVFSQSHFGVIRGNRLEYSQCPTGGPCTGEAAIGFDDADDTSDDFLIEYNNMTHQGDFVNSSGARYIIRNNNLGPVRATALDFPDFPSEHHVDGNQNTENSPFHLVENNWVHGDPDDPCSDFHFVLNQRPNSDGHIVRGNVIVRLGSGSPAWRQADNHRHYKNSYVDANFFQPTVNSMAYAGDADGNPSTGNQSWLNIWDAVCDTAVYFTENGGSITYDWDVAYQSGSQTQVNGLANSNPLFVDRANDDFRLQSGSPARFAGSFDTLANGSGSSTTTLVVDDASRFMDGWDMILGDTITIGIGVMVRITAIVGNTITLAEARSWNDNDVVRWEGRSDAGALPYSMTPLTAATYAVAGTVYTVTPTGDARQVIFYVDGIPHTLDDVPPFTADIASGTVIPVVYALYAQATAVVTATEAGEAGGQGATLTVTGTAAAGSVTLGN